MWEKLEIEAIEADGEEEKKRKAFVRILERAVGADLEGIIDHIKAEELKPCLILCTLVVKGAWRRPHQLWYGTFEVWDFLMHCNETNSPAMHRE